MIVALCAVAAVVAVVGGTLLLSRHESTTSPGSVGPPRPGTPLLQLELGLRRDPEAVALADGEKLLDAKTPQPAQAAAIFERFSSVEARLGLAFAQWTGPGSLAAVKAIAESAPDSPAAALNLGWADYQAGENAAAVSAWQQTARQYPDSPYAVDALDALAAGRVAPSLPPIVVDVKVVPARARPDLEAGIRAWDEKHVDTARRLLGAAVRQAPNTPETLVAAAVALYSPLTPKAPFPVLGPLSGRFPHASIVRLHLGELLLWKLEVTAGEKQLRLATAEQPTSIYAKAAAQYLQALGQK